MIEDYVRRCRLVRVIDGDTIEVTIDLGWGLSMDEVIRLDGVDTCELAPRYAWFENAEERDAHIAAGTDAKHFVQAWLGSFPTEAWPLLLSSKNFDATSLNRTTGDIMMATNQTEGFLTDAIRNAKHDTITNPDLPRGSLR